MGKSEYLGKEQRQYVRLDTVFPVQFRLISLDGKSNLTVWLQGFTSNLGKGGICLCVNNLEPQLAQLIKEHKVKVSLAIDLPISRKPVDALSCFSWMREDAANPGKYYIGLHYEFIDAVANSKLMRYARGRKLFIPVALTAIVLLGISLTLNSLVNNKLEEKNKQLVRELSVVIREAEEVKQKINDIDKEKDGLQSNIQGLESRIQAIENEKALLKDETSVELTESSKKISEKSKKINEFNILLQQLTQEKDRLKNQLVFLKLKESAVSKELSRIDEKKATLAKANIDKMYQWIKVHQNPRTGLVMSFEGDGDIGGWAFIYDQSLAAQAFTNFGDFQRAEKLLDFFNKKAERKGGLFMNAYYVNDGTPSEYVVHSGPNLWLGIAIAQYTRKAQDKKYLNLAEGIAEGIISLQKQDREGGLRGGPSVEWYSSEHNLDAYAFFNMMYSLTNKQKYLDARDKILTWLVKNTYDKMDIPVKRGKGDSTIATDTYAWSIAAIGPEKLEALGMNPDRIMEFAEKTCVADVSYTKPDGEKVRVKGFDFASQKNVARGGIVSSEWTAQMVISFKIMAEYYSKKGMSAKSSNYQAKANEYLSSLGKMLISSPSASGQGESCLPYASQDFVDTGHGWYTPKGKDTGSVSGTTYTIFAYYNYNPLEFS